MTSAVAAGARSALGVPDVEMLYLLGVMATALTGGRRPSLLAAGLAVVSYDFFFVPPPYTLDVADARYLLTFAMMFGVSVLISTLTLRLRDERSAALSRERRASALHALARDLGAAQDERAVGDACVRSAASALDGAAVFLRGRAGEEPATLASSPATALAPREDEAARWALAHGRPAGLGAEVHAEVPVLCIPVQAWGDVAAVLVVRPAGGRPVEDEPRALLEAIARQAALALDRIRLSEDARAAALRADSERMRSSLLSAVSHDFRTPLAAITGAATTLRDEPGIDAATARELVEAICDEADRLERMVSNLLEMTRLDSGRIEPKREWIPADEIVGVALDRLGHALAGRPITTAIDPELPLVSVDRMLIEQLLVNLLENAAKYTPPGTALELRCAREEDRVVMEVSDDGPGIAAGDEERVFERFQRGAHPGVRGVGLGLAVARAIAQAHGGDLSYVRRRPGGGACFRLRLPLAPGAPRPSLDAAGSAAP